jgi:hypothetical protein
MNHSTSVCKPLYTDQNIDGLIRHVLSLPASELWHFFDRLTGHPKIKSAGWHISERRVPQCRNAKRDAEMVRLHDGGLTYSDIARLYHLSPFAVSRACQRFRRRKRDNDSVSPFCLPYN